jgi:microcystin-dependent protein
MMNIHKVRVKYISASLAITLAAAVTALAADKLYVPSHLQGSFYNEATADTIPSPQKNKQRPLKKNTPAIADTIKKMQPADTIPLSDSAIIPAGQKKGFLKCQKTVWMHQCIIMQMIQW